MRRRRTPLPGVIAVTGASRGLGHEVVRRLAGHQVLALDTEVPLVRDPSVTWRQVDVRDPLLAEHLVGVATLVHLAIDLDPLSEPVARQALNVRGTASVLEAARSAGVRRVVLVTSVDVYGAHPGVPLPLPESAALLAAAGDSLIGDLVEVERLADHALRTGLDVVVLRPAALVGAALGPAYDGALLHSLSATRLLALRGVEPLWQLCHVDDLLSVLELAALGQVSGALAVTCDGWLTQREVEQLSGRRRLELPAAVAVSTAERLHRLGVSPGSPGELDRLLHPLVVDGAGLRSAGWSPSWTCAAALTAHVGSRPPPTVRAGLPAGGATAGATAAGATVALMGTAAMVRRVRRRRRL